MICELSYTLFRGLGEGRSHDFQNNICKSTHQHPAMSFLIACSQSVDNNISIAFSAFSFPPHFAPGQIWRRQTLKMQ